MIIAENETEEYQQAEHKKTGLFNQSQSIVWQ